MKKKSTFWQDFKAFISRGNVVDMAIGVVVAAAFKDIVTKFTSAFISPIVALLTDGADLSDMKWIVRPERLDAEGKVLVSEVSLAYGPFIQAVIDFLIIALVLFIVIRIFTKASAKAKELTISKEEADAKAKAAEEAAAKAAAEKKAAEEARLAAEAEAAAAKAREIETVELLKEIRNSLANK
ncbi:MAG: large conductance mechanosensitive channel protein MscL [Eubacteriales bacterium]